MSTVGIGPKIRSLELEDVDAILSIDRSIRRMGKAITYGNITAENLLTIDRKTTRRRRATSYIDLITGDISNLLEQGLVAELDGRVRGFIMNRIDRVGEAGIQVGVIAMLGVHPDYWRKGIGKRLVDAMNARFRAMGIKRVRIGIDQRDKDLLGFFEHMGFSVGHHITYSKTL